ncbi:hypothetical protein [Rhizorhapis suberifaciens]|uniref:Uncharacterized protein n=1 Tax=Rhizorhapis suberifaciens TaxID=13656 RepID=A0A840HTP5_9SPHN|nr:hypothetical protein [Rhizorhapis suberifaciens]MBB4641572.1 hypothetical protein [Rhizorhapis suberifaciens]
MHKSAHEFPSHVDEFEAVGLEKAPSVVVRPPRVALAPDRSGPLPTIVMAPGMSGVKEGSIMQYAAFYASGASRASRPR